MDEMEKKLLQHSIAIDNISINQLIELLDMFTNSSDEITFHLLLELKNFIHDSRKMTSDELKNAVQYYQNQTHN